MYIWAVSSLMPVWLKRTDKEVHGSFKKSYMLSCLFFLTNDIYIYIYVCVCVCVCVYVGTYTYFDFFFVMQNALYFQYLIKSIDDNSLSVICISLA